MSEPPSTEPIVVYAYMGTDLARVIIADEYGVTLSEAEARAIMGSGLKITDWLIMSEAEKEAMVARVVVIGNERSTMITEPFSTEERDRFLSPRASLLATENERLRALVAELTAACELVFPTLCGLLIQAWGNDYNKPRDAQGYIAYAALKTALAHAKDELEQTSGRDPDVLTVKGDGWRIEIG